MNALVWNCRGLGNSWTFRDLDALMRQHNPKLVFLSKTMISESRVKNMRWRLGMKGCLAIDNRGRSGGIALLWDENIHVNLLSIGDRYIDVSIKENPHAESWRATFICGEPRIEDRHRTWEILQRLKNRSPEPWIVIGDFNEAMWQFEHFSETRRGEKQMENFRDALDFCDLRDVGFRGTPWTYDNGKQGSRNVKVRLDRGVANQSWLNRFFDASITHLTSPCSDHCPLLLQVQRRRDRVGRGDRCIMESCGRENVCWTIRFSKHGKRNIPRVIWV